VEEVTPMFEISFMVDGRKVSPDKVGDALERVILKKIQGAIKEAVGAVRCPEHGQGAKVVAKGRDLSKLSFEVSGCCEALIKEVERKLEHL
jgi:hypothetical protein